MPRGSAVDDVEKKLKKRYPGNPGAVYGTLNRIGLKHGNKTTAKGMKPAKTKIAAKRTKAPKVAKEPAKVKVMKRKKKDM